MKRTRRAFVAGWVTAVILAATADPVRAESPTFVAGECSSALIGFETGTPVAAAVAPGSLTLTCADGARPVSGVFHMENNTWNKRSLTGWSQCVGIGNGGAGGIVARWTWDWLNVASDVKAYPAVVFGQKPGGSTTSPGLPRRVNDLQYASASWNVASVHTGTGNLAFDIWLTNTANPTTFGAPPITHEIMIWLEAYGGMVPGGILAERAVLDGLVIIAQRPGPVMERSRGIGIRAQDHFCPPARRDLRDPVHLRRNAS